MKPPFVTVTVLALVLASSGISSAAETVPPWYTPADSIAVISSSNNGGFAYALVRDSAMRNHNVFCVTVGAHIGNLRVAAIGPDGVLLSNGRMLRNPAVATSPATLATAQEAVGH